MLSACGQPHGKNQADLKAPSSQEEAKSRFIIQGTPSDTQAVLSASESHRVLSAKHNLYEVKGLNYLEIKKLLQAFTPNKTNTSKLNPLKQK